MHQQLGNINKDNINLLKGNLVIKFTKVNFGMYKVV